LLPQRSGVTTIFWRRGWLGSASRRGSTAATSSGGDNWAKTAPASDSGSITVATLP
jgi:hypothetical protein